MGPVLLASDAINLADFRQLCPDCVAGDPACDRCDENGTVAADTGREALSHTRLSTKLACPRKFELSYRERLERIDTPLPLEMGRAFAHGLQHSDPAAAAGYLYEHATVNDQYDEDRARINAAIVAAGVRYYLSRWGDRERHAREIEYRVQLRSPYTGAYSRTFDLTGRADAVIDCGAWLEVIEDKFLGALTEVGVRRLRLDRQISLACYGLWRATGKPVRVVHYRMTRKPSIDRRKGRTNKTTGEVTGAETVTEFIARLDADYADPARRDFYGYEESLFRSEEDLALIEAELWQWAAEIRAGDRAEVFPRNTASCLDHGGCKFLPICGGDPDALSLYRRREDAPIATPEAA